MAKGKLRFDEEEVDAAAAALIAWFRSQDILPAKAVVVMMRVVAEVVEESLADERMSAGDWYRAIAKCVTAFGESL